MLNIVPHNSRKGSEQKIDTPPTLTATLNDQAVTGGNYATHTKDIDRERPPQRIS